MKDDKVVWRWWWGWNTEKVENWLEEMEQKGWNLVKVDFAQIRFSFKKGESRKMSYCFDYPAYVKDNYFEIFKEDGWESMDNKMGPWFIWSKSYENERPSIYTDTKSLIEKNNRQIRTVIFGVFVTLFLLSLVLLGNFDSTKLISALLILSIVFYGYIIVQLRQNNKKLKQNAIKC
ncbi:MAG: DUF2812 domain-containing protein [Methanobacteriaceae archaeon]|nr:DUF2812 domain-containing protein [Methanobacteriaceae archaeon]